MLSCQSKFRHHFSCFSTYSSIAILAPSAILAATTYHLTPVHVSLAAMSRSESAQYDLGLCSRMSRTRVGRHGLHLPCRWQWYLGPRSSGIAMSMPDGASNSCCVCLACSLSPTPRTIGIPWQALRLGSGSEPPASTTWWRDRAHWWSWWRKAIVSMHGRWCGRGRWSLAEVAMLSRGEHGTMPSLAAVRHVWSNASSHYPLRFGLD
jgi:hypothetical protein